MAPSPSPAASFTKATTSVTVDSASTPFDLVSSEELTLRRRRRRQHRRGDQERRHESAEIDDAAAPYDPQAAAPRATRSDDDETQSPRPDQRPAVGRRHRRQYQPAKIEAGTGPEPYPINANTNVGQQVDPTRFGGGAQHGIAGAGNAEVFTTYAGDEVYKAFIPAGMEVAPQAIAPGTWPTPIDGYRAAVAGVPLVGLIPVGDEKTPYPTGASLAAGKHFWLQNGYYKSATPT